MPMGIVSDTDFEKELEKVTPTFNPLPPIEPKVHEGVVLPKETPGRKEGDNNVPESFRKLIGETAAIEGRSDALALAKQFGISPSSVAAYSNGATSTASYDDAKHLDHIIKAKEKISKNARAKIIKAMRAITDDKLEACKAPELAQVARSLSSVAKDMEPENLDANSKKGPQFVIYAPQVKDERHYEVIVTRE